MSIDSLGWGSMAIVLIIAVVTLATRWGGVFVMSFVPINYRVKQFIEAMSGSVLVALLALLALEGDGGARLALATTATVMLVLKRPLPAIAAGMLAAALFRQFRTGSPARGYARYASSTPASARSSGTVPCATIDPRFIR
jgi:uncharacterized membrane protein